MNGGDGKIPKFNKRGDQNKQGVGILRNGDKCYNATEATKTGCHSSKFF